MKVYCLFSLESPQRGDSNEYTQDTLFNVRKKIIPNYPESATIGFVARDPRVSNSRGKRAISVRAFEVSLCIKAAHAILGSLRLPVTFSRNMYLHSGYG